MAATTADSKPYYTLAEGVPLPRNDTSDQILTGSGGGFVLLTSTQLIENLAHFSRERISERTVHAKAAGARGHYEVTDDISDLTDADFLTGVGKKTEVLTRISTVGPESGSADTVRDFRGFAIKFKTREGNNDWVFNNQPVFFVRDPVKFPSLNRSHKRHPGTNSSNADMFWDFHINNQESIHALMFLFGDRGLPSSVRHVNAYSGNTYKFTKSDGSYHYVRIHFLSNQGIHYYTNSEGAQISGSDPDRHLLDLQDAIKSGDYPSWDVYVQVNHPNEIAGAPVDIFDMTKVWPHNLYPRRKAGRIVLDRNPQNWFAEIEQAAFSPSNIVPGIEPSPDPMLQARMFAYPDAARYRLGVNYQTLPTNAPHSVVYCPIERDGLMNFTKNYGTDPNYVGSKLKPTRSLNKTQAQEVGKFDQLQKNRDHDSEISRLNTLDHARATKPLSFVSEVTDKDFEQATALWHIMAKQEGAQLRFINNLSEHLSDVTEDWIRAEAYAMFGKVDPHLGKTLRKVTEATIKEKHAHSHVPVWH
ncbi:putative catalase [Phaeomoniella chlamydospora]|uniref:Putative catalase n=1 Tax=Phaeomoniella chlamydospora TaxID=158046 RepID=A0A0G2GPI3_PHACM|nr:putative catalase [Phaeomoniella chlamydospora]